MSYFSAACTVNEKQMAQQVLLTDDYMLCDDWNNIRSFEFVQVDYKEPQEVQSERTK